MSLYYKPHIVWQHTKPPSAFVGTCLSCRAQAEFTLQNTRLTHFMGSGEHRIAECPKCKAAVIVSEKQTDGKLDSEIRK